MVCRRVRGNLADLLDFIYTPNNAAEDKYCRESLAVDYLSCLLTTSNPSAAAEIKSLFEEFEENKTPEAKFVKEIDAFECLVQAEEYEERGHEDHRLSDFLHLQSRISSKDLSRWTKLLAEERSAISLKRSTDTVIVFVIGKYNNPATGTSLTRPQVAQELAKALNVPDLLQILASNTSPWATFSAKKPNGRHPFMPTSLTKVSKSPLLYLHN
jgi:hypothetical protein